MTENFCLLNKIYKINLKQSFFFLFFLKVLVDKIEKKKRLYKKKRYLTN